MKKKVAFLFPGQGSQSLNMLDGIKDIPVVTNTFNSASEELGCDFLSMLQEPSSDSINQTINTQPLMLSAGYATYVAYLQSGGLFPDVVAGHSLGEFSALVASGAMAFLNAVKLVRLRAQLMQTAVPDGSGQMAAVIALDDAKVIEVCQEVSATTNSVVEAVNFNAPGQVVIAGDVLAVDIASTKLKEAGARMVQKLPVSVPSHCALMLNAKKQLMDALNEIEIFEPKIPIVHNFNAKCYVAKDNVHPKMQHMLNNPDSNVIVVDSHQEWTRSVKVAISAQVCSPVLWSQSIRNIVNFGIEYMAECGPGKVLNNLNKRINNQIMSYPLHNDVDFTNLRDIIG